MFADDEAALADAAKQPADDAAAIAYLKEQQWTNEFATAPVQETEVRTSIRVPATVDALPGGEAVVSAPAPGRFLAETLPDVGDRVTAGQALGRLEPRLTAGDDRATLASDVAEAQAALEAARAEMTRAERLLADQAVPARRVEEAKRATTVAEARLRAAEARLAQRDETLRSGGGAAAGNAFVLRAPIAGRIVDVMATLGASYDEGAALFKIARTDAVELRADVPAADAARARRLTAVALELPGRPDPVPLQVPSRPRPRRPRPHHQGARPADGGRESRRRAADRPGGHGHSLHRRDGTDAGGSEGRRADGSGPSLRVRADRRRTICPAADRDRGARRRRGRRQERASSPASAW